MARTYLLTAAQTRALGRVVTATADVAAAQAALDAAKAKQAREMDRAALAGCTCGQGPTEHTCGIFAAIARAARISDEGYRLIRKARSAATQDKHAA